MAKLKRTIICAVISIIALGGLATLIAWLADRMKSPAFTIDTATVTGYNLTADSRLNATFNLSIRAHNRDSKYTIKYRVIIVSVYHNGYTLAYQTLAPFVQGHGDEFILDAVPTARNVIIADDDVAGDLRNGTRNGNRSVNGNGNGQLTVEVRVRAAVRFEVVRWKHRSYTLKIICSNVVINFDSGKTSQPTKCDVDRF